MSLSQVLKSLSRSQCLSMTTVDPGDSLATSKASTRLLWMLHLSALNSISVAVGHFFETCLALSLVTKIVGGAHSSSGPMIYAWCPAELRVDSE